HPRSNPQRRPRAAESVRGTGRRRDPERPALGPRQGTVAGNVINEYPADGSRALHQPAALPHPAARAGTRPLQSSLTELTCQTPASLAGEVQSTKDEGVENPVGGDDAVADATGSLAAIGLQVDQVLLLLGPDELDQAAETGVRFD